MALPANVKNKKQGDIIRSDDWNVVTNEVDRLDSAKANLVTPTFTGPLNIQPGKLGVGAAQPLMSIQANTPSFWGAPAIGGAIQNAQGTGLSWLYLHVSPSIHSIIWDEGRSLRFGVENAADFNAPDASRRYRELLRITPEAGGGTGIYFPSNIAGGAGDIASIRYINKGPDLTTLEIRTGNDTPGSVTDDIDIIASGNLRLMGGATHVSSGLQLANSDLYFTKTNHVHTGIGNTAGYAAIENASSHSSLMILGRMVGTLRRISMWDHLEMNGNAFKPGGGAWGTLSDEKLKKNIKPVSGALNKLLSLKGVNYEWKDPAKHGNLTGVQTGFIAQEVESVFPDWVDNDIDDLKTLSIRGFEALVVEALRDLKTEIDEIKTNLGIQGKSAVKPPKK